MEFLEQDGLLSDGQYGFRKGRSTTLQLLEVLDDITKDIDEGNAVDILYLDFQKAFDTVPHKRLVKKLEVIGIEGRTTKWIEAFLQDRRQRVVVNGESSNWSRVASGVPQGSVLGPVLFLIYINDIMEVTSSKTKLFADDTKLYGPCNTEADIAKLQHDLGRLEEWSRKWQVKFNAEKCKSLHFGYNNQKNKYSMGLTEIQQGNEEKDLGVTFDHKLKFSNHVAEKVKKANRLVGMIRRSFQYMDKAMFIPLYKALIRPQLEYAVSVWSPMLIKDVRAIENVQRRATKLVTAVRDLPYPERLRTLGLPTLQYRRKRYDVIQVYRILNGVDTTGKAMFVTIEDNRTRGHNSKIRQQYARLDCRKYSFSVRVVRDWNSLSDHVISAPSVNAFKSRLNNFWKGEEIKFNPNCY